ncbi:DUF2865 domain-containing protein [Phyllobacterium sp. LjRoot231]|uniref:DUF2865 domain-containing protein n=1 Tax=Phyllobacterium sp. LjRoot231 TaxID=3342289 RepID=UPI003ECDEE3C
MTILGRRMYRTFQIAFITAAAILAATQLSSGNSNICARMQDRLDELNRNADVDDFELTLRRDRVEAALDANDCPVVDDRVHEEPRRDTARPQPYEVLGKEPEPVEPEMSTAPVYGGRYQTLCVRTCDGYYFPLSYETGAENFSRDQAQCQSQCPGAKLYYQPTDNPNPERMTSLSGEDYKDLPNAFKFRKVGANATPQCGCQRSAANFSTLGNPAAATSATGKPGEPAKIIEPVKPVETKVEPAVPAPQPAEKPSSIIQLGEPAPAKTEAPLPQPLSGDKPIDPNRKVRVVGPTFLPDQEGAINLRAPDQKTAQ